MCVGRLIVVVGPMCSGKSDYLIRTVKRAEIRKRPVLVIKPTEDTRSKGIWSRSGYQMDSNASLNSVLSSLQSIEESTLVVLDEVHLFSDWGSVFDLVESVLYLDRNCEILISGLDMDFRGEPFDNVGRLLAMADNIIKLTAVCSTCGNDAQLTQRLIDGRPALASDPTIVIDIGEVEYEPRCRNCHEVGECSERGGLV
jgi:thymidine kinase